MTVMRRSLFQWLLAWCGASLLLPRSGGAEHGDDMPASGDTGPLTARVMRPFNAETPVGEFMSFLTANHRFFVRSHFGPPPAEALEEGRWRLRVGGLVERPRTLTLQDLKQLPPFTVTAVVQCSGNGRAHYRPKVAGVQWDRGAVGNAEWTGVRLKDVLHACGIRDEGQHVQFQGADRPVVASVPLFIRSIPVKKALHPDTLLAYEMNGRPLPLLHGAPLRVITPGWMAESCLKWLTDITVRTEEADGYYMQTAYRAPVRPVTPETPMDRVAMVPVEEMPVKSLIAAPANGDSVKMGPVTIQGVAWGSDASIAAVEISLDDGRTWKPARLVGDARPYAWRQWQFIWKPDTAGPVMVQCRATDERGRMQPAQSPWNPSGFLWNGWDQIRLLVTA